MTPLPSTDAFELAWASSIPEALRTFQASCRIEGGPAPQQQAPPGSSSRASPPTYLCTPAIAPAYASPNDPDNPRCIQAIRGDEGCTALGARQVRWEMPCLHAHSFDSPASTKRALNEYAQHHGYGLVTTSTYRDNETNALYSATRRAQAQCSVAELQLPNESLCGARKWRLVHNHPPSNHAASHPVHRRNAMTSVLRVAIATDSDTGTRAAQTLARIYQETPEAPIIARDIYNERSRAVTAALGSSIRVEHLLMLLSRGHFYVAQQVDTSRRLTHLLFAHKERDEHDPACGSSVHARREEERLLLGSEAAKDDVCENGVETPAVVFVDRDLALLNALEQVFPDVPVLLCLWHVVKDVQTHARKHASPPPLSTSETQDPGRRIATSRVEGYHATLKGWVGSSSADLLTIHKRLCHGWTQSITKYRVAKSDAEIKVVTRLRGERFAQVVTKIHRYALLKTLGTYMQAQTLLQPSLSSPLVHRGSAPERAAAPVLEPECIQDRRKQRAAARAALRKHLSGSGVNGTRRIPSAFEVSIQPNLESVTQTVHHYY
ncbi:hypothetical protein PHYSODRAFT_298663 [Phytophthora sojae]|uniref:MULE transposase domain-containing protein n=1 Tax=Phytophthora sojae (strain P6497) TaxID=1094619 RepID=G4ZAX2_PHYSP|nr:hypothetical protein PHYSODRAFT_298663 [Phytophthora sojae]EGZ20600.1 hypothetical protein PHYSODRAFT_298663 [Phytophthora sojae]|eukprot:XP_009523317.1 hypothetical protein PHYSODRAFT_298663 [Phytophthora sojae]